MSLVEIIRKFNLYALLIGAPNAMEVLIALGPIFLFSISTPRRVLLRFAAIRPFFSALNTTRTYSLAYRTYNRLLD